MPISIRGQIRRLDDEEFAEVAFETMRHVFLVHQEIGRFFEEKTRRRPRISAAELRNR